MAINLRRAGVDLTVFNRSAEPCGRLQGLGASVASSADALFGDCDAVILMLPDDRATDSVLGRGGPSFGARVRGRLVINMGTHAPAYSEALDEDVRSAGGVFVEAPVSGSRAPAETGDLLAMVAGAPEGVTRARTIVQPMCRKIIVLGAPPSAMKMKMAVNHYLITTVAALGEAMNMARRSGLDLELYRQVLELSPLRSDVAAQKSRKMVTGDLSPQASIRDVVKNGGLVAATAAAAGAAAPLLDWSVHLFRSVLERDCGELDMAAVLRAFDHPEDAMLETLGREPAELADEKSARVREEDEAS
jgi:3-hydroxyisobutyrate dehydrogenase